MKIGNFEITLGTNEAVIGSVIIFTGALLFKQIPQGNEKMFEFGLHTLVAWGAGLATGLAAGVGGMIVSRKLDLKEKANDED